MPVETIRRISKYLGERILSLTENGLTPLQIRKRLIAEEEIAIQTRSIKLFILRRKKEMETGVKTAPRKRPEKRVLKPQHLEFIDAEMEANDETTARELKRKLFNAFEIDVSISAVKRARVALGWTSTASRYCQIVRENNKPKRLEYCEMVTATDEKFKDVIFTDECTIRMESYVRLSFRRKGCPRKLKCVPKHPYQVHVWAGISRRGATTIGIFTGRLVSEGYQKILSKYLLPFIQEAYPDGCRLYQDNDPKHVSKSTMAYFQKEGIKLMPAPPESPDLNPIELIWANLKYHLRKNVKPKIKEDLVEGILSYWENLPVEMCNKYINHLYKVVPKVIELRGAASGY